jgi:membrane protein DedA with SNARE-associated domain
MTSNLAHWIVQFGPFAIFGLLTLGIFGLPVPDETLLTFAGVLVSHGTLRFGPTWAAAAFGSMVGITLSYSLGRTAGIAVVRRYGRWIHVGPSEIARLEGWLEHRGRWTLLFGYFVPGLRHVTGIVAGSSKLPLSTFATFAYTGACLWSSVFVLLGWFVGDEWEAVLSRLQRHILLASVLVIAVAGGFAILQRRRAVRQ